MKKTALLNDTVFGIWSRQGDPAWTPLPYCHNEFELNLVEPGAVLYLFLGRRIERPVGPLCFLGSAAPRDFTL
jgi:hypothetical protein